MNPKKRIILIDDDYTTNTLNKLIIEKSALVDAVIVFNQAEEALEFLNQEVNSEFRSLIFLDINMPVMDGWDFIDEYGKMNGRMQKNKVVMLTSSIDPSDISKADSIEAISDYRSKPLSIDMVTTLVKDYLN